MITPCISDIDAVTAGFPAAQQTLATGNKSFVFEDGRTLADYDIRHGSILNMSLVSPTGYDSAI